ncbi:MAG: transposase, partial [Bacteroidota bacterium]
MVIDGAKSIRKAVQAVFGTKAIVQRCQWHKRENVVSYLGEQAQLNYRNKLQQVYAMENYEEAKAKLLAIRDELYPLNVSAAKSLEEGLEETLTLKRLGLGWLFHRSFSTTNCIENLNAQLNKYLH